jgi:hypothetical protein
MKNKEFWVFLFFLGTLLFNWPFLDIFNMVLPFYFLGVWGLFILVVYLVVTTGDRKGGERDEDV